jgi:hypothetical protein
METADPQTEDGLVTLSTGWIIRGAMMSNGLTPTHKNDTALNKGLFNENKAGAAKVARLIYLTGNALTSIKTWGDNNGSSGLNEGNATALAKSAWQFTKYLLDDDQPKADGSFRKAIEDSPLSNLIADFIHGDPDDDQGEPLTEDPIGEPLTEDSLVEELLGGTTTEASVQIDNMVSTATIMAVLDGGKDDKVAFIKDAQLAFLADTNLTGQNFFCFRNGGNKRNGIPMVAPKHNLNRPADFIQKVAQHGGFNLAGLACWRGGSNKDYASDLAKSQEAVLDLAIAYCVVASKAGVVKFDHDLRKYISDDTIKALFDRCIDPSADLTHESASTNGWTLPYQRGDKRSSRGDSFKGLVDGLFI